MAHKVKKSSIDLLRLVAILLIHTQLMNSQVFPLTTINTTTSPTVNTTTPTVNTTTPTVNTTTSPTVNTTTSPTVNTTTSPTVNTTIPPTVNTTTPPTVNTTTPPTVNTTTPPTVNTTTPPTVNTTTSSTVNTTSPTVNTTTPTTVNTTSPTVNTTTPTVNTTTPTVNTTTSLTVNTTTSPSVNTTTSETTVNTTISPTVNTTTSPTVNTTTPTVNTTISPTVNTTTSPTVNTTTPTVNTTTPTVNTTTSPTVNTTTPTTVNTTTSLTVNTTTSPTVNTTTPTVNTTISPTVNTTTSLTANTTTFPTVNTTTPTVNTTISPTVNTTISPTVNTTTSPTVNTTTPPTVNTTTPPTLNETTPPTVNTTTPPTVNTTTPPTASTTTSLTANTTTSPTVNTTTPTVNTTISPTVNTTISPTVNTTTSPTVNTTTPPTVNTTTPPTVNTTTSPTVNTTTSPTVNTTTSPTVNTTTAPAVNTTTAPTVNTTTSPTVNTTISPTVNTTTPLTVNTTTPPSTGNTTTTNITTSTSTTSTTRITPSTGTVIVRLSLTLNEEFDFQLNDKSSTIYQMYVKAITSSIDESYRLVPGYQPNSAIVTGFRPGSVIAEFSITATNNDINLSSANTQLATSLRSKGFSVNEDLISQSEIICSDSTFGAGYFGDVSTGNCSINMVGYIKAKCNGSKLWQTIEDNCVVRAIQNLKEEAKKLQVGGIAEFMNSLSSNANSETTNIVDSAATITAIVDILTIVSNLSQTIRISPTIMTDFLETTDVIGTDGTSSTWGNLNENTTTSKVSSLLLNATENIARRLPDENVSITTNFSSLNKTLITAPFSGTFGKNSTTLINIPVANKTFLTVIISSTFNNILPVRTLTNNNNSQTGTQINGDVVLIETNSTIKNIDLSFDIKNKSLRNPQCVFWNFSLLNDVGGWDSTGCQLKPLGNETETYTCECNHTTSFSMLMSPFSEVTNVILDYITYIGVGISMGSLVLCLIIEIIIWKSVTRNDTSYMRHVSIVNIAVSLLIANICFIIGAAVIKQDVGPCSTATFFMHFFYLSLFFWMLLSGLLLLYRTIMVFSRMTRGAMMGIAFSVGYGAPLLIAVITVASTAGRKGYIQKDYNCWLNWNETKALLAFVIPALTTVAINLLVLVLVLCKMLRRGVNASHQPDEKHALLVIAKCVAILTPLFGLTWGFGIGTMVSPNFGIHVVFAFLNSLQGFFILLFGVLLDSKVRNALAGMLLLMNLSSNRTRSTSAGPSSSSGIPFFQMLRQRYVYNVRNDNGNTASASSSSYAVINT